MAKRKKGPKRSIWPWFGVFALLLLTGYLTFWLVAKRRETFPEKEIKELKQPPIITEALAKYKPKIAIIIDDLGYDRHIAQKFLELDIPLTYSILPFSQHGKAIARKVWANGQVVMLHLPMEANNYSKMNPEDGFLFLSMDRETLLEHLKRDLDDIPYIKGVNNHLGSKFTQSPLHMKWVLMEIKRRNLFFVDSMTTGLSKGFSIAQNMGIKTVQRDVFLDNIKEPSAIRAQISQLVDIAERRGFGVAIGHPHLVTYQVLKESIPELKERVELVPVSQLFH